MQTYTSNTNQTQAQTDTHMHPGQLHQDSAVGVSEVKQLSSSSRSNTSRSSKPLAKRLLAGLVLTGLAVSMTSVNAEEMNCKGIAQDTCEMEALCTWVASYERKDGKTINGYCRKSYVSKTKANSKASQTAATKSNP